MYKKIIFMIILINTCSANIYSMVNNTNNTKGLYFDTSLLGQYEPVEGDLKARFFYRMPLIDNNDPLFDNTKLEVGIEGSIGFSGSMANIYVDVMPVNFFSIKIKAMWASYNKLNFGDAVHFGFYTFDSIDAEYNKSIFSQNESEDKNGYIIEIEPTFYANIYIFTIISSIKVTYQDMFTDYFYYDRFSYLLRENNNISLVLNNYLMFNITPINIGVNYSLTYVGDYKSADNLFHKLGILASYSHAFSDIFSLYANMHLGQYLKYNYLTSLVYTELTLGVQFKIF